MLRLIYFYQRWISPLLPPRCRYYPSCSVYAVEAIQLHGSLKGSFLATKRVCRCHPFASGGYDPVPELKSTAHVEIDQEQHHRATHCCKPNR